MIDKLIRKVMVFIYNIGMAFTSLFWKKDKNAVLIGSWFGEKFADNSRFLFQYLSDNKKELGLSHVGWVTRSEQVFNELSDMGYEVYMMDSRESIQFHKKALYHIICDSFDNFAKVRTDIRTEYSWRAIRINLWHGVIGFKGVGYASQNYVERKKRNKLIYGILESLHRTSLYRKFVEYSGGWGDCFFLSTTEYGTDRLKKYFQLPPDHYIETGFARVCGKVRLLPVEERVVEIIKRFSKCILYFPTFRNKDSTFDFHEASNSVKDYLEANNIVWMQKFHSASRERTEQLKIDGNIVTLPHTFDINTIIPYASILVTDYSSVTGDAMYYNIPIIFYTPDIQEYSRTDRGFVIDPKEIMCGPQPNNQDELRKAIELIINNEYKPSDKYIELRKKFYGPPKTMNDIWTDIQKGVK